MNIREAYQHKMEKLAQKYDEYELALRALEEDHPDVLELEAPWITLGPPAHYIVVDETDEDTIPADFGVRAFSATGQQYPINKTQSGGWYMPFKSGGKLFGLNRMGHRKCNNRARVTETRIVEYCGELDEDQYDSVEYLEDEE